MIFVRIKFEKKVRKKRDIIFEEKIETALTSIVTNVIKADI